LIRSRTEEKHHRELEELQSNYDQSRADLQEMTKLSAELKTIHEKEKQKVNRLFFEMNSYYSLI